MRVRFAPSPTGLMHVGNLRTALYNWLLARGSGGTFVLRIEDTDELREHPEAVAGIERVLTWCGLDWDEGPDVGGPHGPYLQSERRAEHLAVADRLIAAGDAYRCWCTPPELDTERKFAEAEKRPYIYSRRCLHLTDAERAEREASGAPSTIRFKMPDEGATVVGDLVRGEVRFENALLGDHVIVRGTGVPTYNFVNPLDDAHHRITHVIRGDDLLSSTPRQVALYAAIGVEPPLFGHLPMILGPDRKRLSKRHGATSAEALREAGYLPEAVVNFLALLGWSYDDQHEIFSLAELVQHFKLENVNPAAAVFDFQKLAWMNGQYIRNLSADELSGRIQGFLAGTASPLAEQPDLVRRATPLVHEKLATLADFEPLCTFLFGPVEIEEEAWQRVAANEHAAPVLGATRAALASAQPWGPESVEAAIRGAAESLGLKPKAAFLPPRVALTGRTISPGLFESAELLGRDESLARLDAALARLG